MPRRHRIPLPCAGGLLPSSRGQVLRTGKCLLQHRRACRNTKVMALLMLLLRRRLAELPSLMHPGHLRLQVRASLCMHQRHGAHLRWHLRHALALLEVFSLGCHRRSRLAPMAQEIGHMCCNMTRVALTPDPISRIYSRDRSGEAPFHTNGKAARSTQRHEYRGAASSACKLQQEKRAGARRQKNSERGGPASRPHRRCGSPSKKPLSQAKASRTRRTPSLLQTRFRSTFSAAWKTCRPQRAGEKAPANEPAYDGASGMDNASLHSHNSRAMQLVRREGRPKCQTRFSHKMLYMSCLVLSTLSVATGFHHCVLGLLRVSHVLGDVALQSLIAVKNQVAGENSLFALAAEKAGPAVVRKPIASSDAECHEVMPPSKDGHETKAI